MSLKKFAYEAAKLKDVDRTGWVDHKVSKPENVADHCWRTALLAWLYARKFGLDENRAIKIALIHDLPEAIAGDVRSRHEEKHQKISTKEKHELELEAADKIFSLLPKKEAEELYGIWLDGEEQKTPEGKLVKDLDRVEMVLQALYYEKEKRAGTDLSEFFEYSKARVKNKELNDFVVELEKERPKK